MKISTKGRYAVRLMYDLAMHHTGDWIALKDISRRQEISVKYLEQIVRQLSIRGYLKSLRGPKGGYQLSRDPKDYTIYEILKITEGSLQPVACLDDKVNQCERYHECPTIEIWEGLGQVIEERGTAPAPRNLHHPGGFPYYRRSRNQPRAHSHTVFHLRRLARASGLHHVPRPRVPLGAGDGIEDYD